MTKHLYLNSSNLDYTKIFHDMKGFRPLYDYIYTIRNAHSNEWGKFVIDDIHIHILLGNIKQKSCPWCGTKPVLKKLSKDDSSVSSYCMHCPQCLCNGPVLKINTQIEKDLDYMQYFKQLIEDKFYKVKSWDADIKFED